MHKETLAPRVVLFSETLAFSDLGLDLAGNRKHRLLACDYEGTVVFAKREKGQQYRATQCFILEPRTALDVSYPVGEEVSFEARPQGDAAFVNVGGLFATIRIRSPEG